MPIQKSFGLPEINTRADYDENIIIPGNSFNSPARSFTATGQMSVPIYQGGAVRNAGARRKIPRRSRTSRPARDRSERFPQVVGAYMDVIRDQAIVQLNQKNVSVLRTNLQATSDRFEIGDLTRTDVAQSEARLALAEGGCALPKPDLIASRESYIRLVGDAPVDLQAPPTLPNLPASAEEAVASRSTAIPTSRSARSDGQCVQGRYRQCQSVACAQIVCDARWRVQ